MILTLSCPDRHGIVAAVSAFLLERDANISDAQQFGDALSGYFFMRVVFEPTEEDVEAAIRAAFASLAQRFEMDWTLRGLITALPALRAVAFNGGLAAKLGRRILADLPDLDRVALIDLPSSSPAHAISLSAKAESWAILSDFLPE